MDVKSGEQSVDFVGVDDKRGAFMAIEHLIALGHTRIALITGPQETATEWFKNHLSKA